MTDEPGRSQEFYCRDEAAAWFQARGLRHITAAALKKMATKHQGPKRLRMGKFVYYTEADMQAWLDIQVAMARSVRRGRRAGEGFAAGVGAGAG